MRPPPQCSQRLLEDLEQLRQKENLELLRAPLVEYSIFPPDKDPATLPITADELKKLVRHWKLHETRAFWKMHPTKEDLVHALLEHMADKEDSLGFSSTPRPPASPRPSRKSRRRQEGAAAPPSPNRSSFEIGIRDYNGDLFGRGNCTGGMVYLSRIKHRGEDDPDKQRTSTRKQNSTCLTVEEGLTQAQANPDLEGKRSPRLDSGNEENTKKESEQARDVCRKLLQYSCILGKETTMVEEGALPALRNLTLEQDLEISSSTAATLCNLACDRSVVRTMLQNGFCSDISRHVMHSTGDVQLCWGSLLTQFSAEANYEEMLVTAAMHFASSVAQPDCPISSELDASLFAAAILGNVSCTEEKESLMEKLKATCQPIVQAEVPEAWAVLVLALHNLTLSDRVLPALVDGGSVVLLREIYLVKLPNYKSIVGEPLLEIFQYCSARGIANLSCCVDTRRLMVKDGAVMIIVQIAQETKSSTVLELCTLSLMNLTSPNPNNPNQDAITQMQDLAISHGAVDSLVRLAQVKGLGEGAYTQIGYALYTLTTLEASLDFLVSKETHTAFALLTELALEQKVMPLLHHCASGFCNLLSLRSTQAQLVNGGLAELLTRMIESSEDAQLRVYCGRALSNLTQSLHQYTMSVHSLLLKAFSILSSEASEDIRTICVGAFASFSSFSNPEVLQQMIHCGVPSKILGLLEGAQERLIFQCAATLENLSRHENLHKALYDQDCMTSLNNIAKTAAEDTLFRCAYTLKNLSKTPQDPDQTITAIAEVQRNASDPATLKVTAEAVFVLSCSTACRDILSRHAVIIKQMFGIMRGGTPDTQLCSARALCNMAGNSACAKTMLQNAIVDDFIVIAILRTNSEKEDVKAACAYTLFNMLHDEEYRTKMVKRDVLWAVIKLSKLESTFTRTVAMQVLYNLTCSKNTCQTVMDLGVGHVLTVIGVQASQQTCAWAASTLYNLSKIDSFAETLILEGAIPILRDQVSRAPENLHLFAQTLYNMSQCSIQSRRRLVRDGADVLMSSLMETLRIEETESAVVIEILACSLFNLATDLESQAQLAEHGVGEVLIQKISEAWPTRVHVCLLGLMLHLSATSQSSQQITAAGATATCVHFSNHPDQNVRKLTAQLLRQLASHRENHLRLVADNCILALDQLFDDQDLRLHSIETTAMVSQTKEGATELVSSGLLDLIWRTVSESHQIQTVGALTLRNLTSGNEATSLICQKTSLVPLLQHLSKTLDEHMATHVSTILYNIVHHTSCDTQLTRTLQPILNKLYRFTKNEDLRRLCGTALVTAQEAYQDTTTYTEGSVLALVETLDTSKGQVPLMDCGPVSVLSPSSIDSRLIHHYFSLVNQGPTIRAHETIRHTDVPDWKPFHEQLTQMEDSDAVLIAGLDLHTCPAPRPIHVHVSGKLLKVWVNPEKQVVVAVPETEPHSHTDSAAVRIKAPKFGLDISSTFKGVQEMIKE